MDAQSLTNIASNSEPSAGGGESQTKVRPVSGWADMWSWITLGLGAFGCLSIARLFWPGSEVTQWVAALIAVVIWVLGCRFSGLIANSYDFPEGKFAGIKRFFSGAIGLTAFVSLVFLRDGWPQITRGNLAVAALIFLVGGLVKAGSSPKPM